MKVIAFNGSPRKENNTGMLVNVVFKELEKEGIETEMINVAHMNFTGCIACGGCKRAEDQLCILNDGLKDLQKKMIEADGIILASPVYFADASAQIKSFADRAFYSPAVAQGVKQKVGASVISVRRAGALHAYHTLNSYFGIRGMYTVGATYWNLGMGLNPGDCMEDAEGIRNMEALGQNMAHLLKKLNA